MQKFDKSTYDKDKRFKITLFLNKKNDEDIIKNIDFNNKQGSIKQLIRKSLKE